MTKRPWQQKYILKTYETLSTKVKKGELQKYKDAAEKDGMSFRSWLIEALEEKIKRGE